GAVALGTRAGFVVGVAVAHLAFWLDHVDGQVARWRGAASLDGVYLDYLMHHAAALSLGFALGYGLAARTGDPRWAAAGFAVALGWAGLGLHNDCRYKAFFQRLKRESRAYRVDGGSGRRPGPAGPLAARGARVADLAGVQGVRAARCPAGAHGTRRGRDRIPRVVARPLGLGRRRDGRSSPGAGGRQGRARGRSTVRRGGI